MPRSGLRARHGSHLIADFDRLVAGSVGSETDVFKQPILHLLLAETGRFRINAGGSEILCEAVAGQHRFNAVGFF